MKCVLGCVLMFSMSAVIFLGCGEKATTTKETTVTTPEGSTTVTTTEEVETTGENPPAVNE